MAIAGPKPHPVILNAVKDLKKLGRDAVELWRPSPALVILNAVKNLVLYAGVAPFLWSVLVPERVPYERCYLGAEGRDSSLRSE